MNAYVIKIVTHNSDRDDVEFIFDGARYRFNDITDIVVDPIRITRSYVSHDDSEYVTHHVLVDVSRELTEYEKQHVIF